MTGDDAGGGDHRILRSHPIQTNTPFPRLMFRLASHVGGIPLEDQGVYGTNRTVLDFQGWAKTDAEVITIMDRMEYILRPTDEADRGTFDPVAKMSDSSIEVQGFSMGGRTPEALDENVNAFFCVIPVEFLWRSI